MWTNLDTAAQSLSELWEASYDEEVPRRFSGTHATIKEAMLFHLTDGGCDRPLIQYGDDVITRGQADEAACRLANGLIDAGIEKGDRVSIVVSNRPETVIAFMACYKAGFVAAAYNQRCASREIVHAIDDVCSTALIVESDVFPKVIPALQQDTCPDLRLVVVLDQHDASTHEEVAQFVSTGWTHDSNGVTASPEGVIPKIHKVVDYDVLLATSDACEPSIPIRPEDNAILLFTGGTTGVSKGCCQTHERMTLELESMHRWVASCLTVPDPSFLVCMPMTHIMGINYGVNWQLINGGSVVIAQGSKPPDIMAALDRYHPTVWAALPTLLHSVDGIEELGNSPYRNLELIIFGGSFIAKETLESLAAQTDARFVESYGMSESFGFVTCNPVGSMGKLGSIGLPLSNTDVLIVDLRTGTRVLDFGERGEVVFRGPQIIREYWNNPGETEIALRDGWLFSGDIGYMDEAGYFYLVDRKKDTIVVSGFNVFPKEIDEILVAHPDVVDACTVGVPDDHSGERPKSYIVMREGSQTKIADLLAYCREYLVAYKVPKYMESVAKIPKTKARKPDREFLRRANRAASSSGDIQKPSLDSQEP